MKRLIFLLAFVLNIYLNAEMVYECRPFSGFVDGVKIQKSEKELMKIGGYFTKNNNKINDGTFDYIYKKTIETKYAYLDVYVRSFNNDSIKITSKPAYIKNNIDIYLATTSTNSQKIVMNMYCFDFKQIKKVRN